MTFIVNHDTWRRVKFGDVVQKVNAKVNPGDGRVSRYVAGEHMDTDGLRISRWGEIGDGYLGPAFHTLFRAGQVLYGSRRTYLRKVALSDFDGVCANTTFVLETRHHEVLLPELLPFVMSTEAFHAHSIAESKGSVNPYVNWPDIAKYEFNLPPLEDQQRIADLLWSSRRNVEAQRELVSRLRGVRVAFVDKRLSGADEEKPLGQLVEKLGDGPFGSKIKSEHYSSEPGTRVLRLQDVGDGRIKDDDVAWLRSEYVHDNLASYLVEAGDFVVAGLGDERNPVGRAALADSVVGSVHKADIFRGKPKVSLVTSEYLVEALNSFRVRPRVLARAQGTTRMRINTTNMKLVLVPLLPLIEQQRLANDLAVIDEAIVRQGEDAKQSELLGYRLLEEVIG